MSQLLLTQFSSRNCSEMCFSLFHRLRAAFLFADKAHATFPEVLFRSAYQLSSCFLFFFPHVQFVQISFWLFAPSMNSRYCVKLRHKEAPFFSAFKSNYQEDNVSGTWWVHGRWCHRVFIKIWCVFGDWVSCIPDHHSCKATVLRVSHLFSVGTESRRKKKT